MRRCKFCLCYDDYPEPFGIYPLDAVWNGTPVYTNGAGNLRHLLPQGHGIHAFETPAMWTGSPRRRFAAFGVAAERIACELSAGVPRSALRRWRNAISQRYGFDAFHMSLSGVVEYARTPAVLPPLELSELRIALSPLVRSWAGRGRVILSDYAHLELLPDATRVLSASLGRGVASLRREPEAVRETLQELFRLGVLALQPPPAAHVRLRGRQR
jgi:hypothetical protein